jgi:hypothetical protein
MALFDYARPIEMGNTTRHDEENYKNGFFRSQDINIKRFGTKYSMG